MSKENAPILEIRGLKRHFAVSRGLFSSKTMLKAVDGVDFSVMPQESFAVVGESGCGKTTLARLLLALDRPTAGEVLFEGNNIFSLRRGALRRLRRDMQIIFQDPYSSLNPRMTVEELLTEPFVIHGIGAPGERRERVKRLMGACGLAQSKISSYPHEFSGGQRQRIGIARALALNPKLVIADEPVSALDVSIQAQILNLLKDLQKEMRLTYIFISHDFSTVRHLCRRIAVMYLGRVVEMGQTESLLGNPQHPYTEALLSAIPVPDPNIEKKRTRIILTGDVPSPLAPPSGCHFHPRCRYATEACKSRTPELLEIQPEHWVACPVSPFVQKPSAAALVH
ncbi:MAG: dipeptide ABC transporter ATP-binding protein [Elusimicrobia bacterium]|nr:dipeptide ABC transporter ATP-binding protein [Elusimicrobiota bacterium]MDE2312863.1 dipeptide ABC transporter ATP-binding protein [Elusimicrobiota bacterium]